MKRADRNFNHLINKFENHIYDMLKGIVRQAVLWEDFSGALAQLPTAPLRRIDASVGLGQLARRFAELGHQLVICVISEKMSQRAQQAAEQAGVLRQMPFIQLMTTRRRRSGSLQPPHPLTGEQVGPWLTALLLTTLTQSSVKVFSEHWQPSVQQNFDPQAMMALKQHDGGQPAFISLGRYRYYLVQKPRQQLSRVGIAG